MVDQAPGASGSLQAGVARVVITPPIGIHLTGFAGRPPSTGVHDDLTATALVLAAPDAPETERVAIVALDVLGMYGDQIAGAIKSQVERTTGLPGDRLLLCCSHTHYGPVFEGREGGDAPLAVSYRETLTHLVAGAVQSA